MMAYTQPQQMKKEESFMFHKFPSLLMKIYMKVCLNDFKIIWKTTNSALFLNEI